MKTLWIIGKSSDAGARVLPTETENENTMLAEKLQ